MAKKRSACRTCSATTWRFSTWTPTLTTCCLRTEGGRRTRTGSRLPAQLWRATRATASGICPAWVMAGTSMPRLAWPFRCQPLHHARPSRAPRRRRPPPLHRLPFPRLHTHPSQPRHCNRCKLPPLPSHARRPKPVNGRLLVETGREKVVSRAPQGRNKEGPWGVGLVAVRAAATRARAPARQEASFLEVGEGSAGRRNRATVGSAPRM